MDNMGTGLLFMKSHVEGNLLSGLSDNFSGFLGLTGACQVTIPQCITAVHSTRQMAAAN